MFEAFLSPVFLLFADLNIARSDWLKMLRSAEDIGTGSGFLAMLAAKYGAKKAPKRCHFVVVLCGFYCLGLVFLGILLTCFPFKSFIYIPQSF